MRVFLRHNQSNNKLSSGNTPSAAGNASPVGSPREDKRKQQAGEQEDERKVAAKKQRHSASESAGTAKGDRMEGGGKLFSAPKEPPLEVRTRDESGGDAAGYAQGSAGGRRSSGDLNENAPSSEQEEGQKSKPESQTRQGRLKNDSDQDPAHLEGDVAPSMYDEGTNQIMSKLRKLPYASAKSESLSDTSESISPPVASATATASTTSATTKGNPDEDDPATISKLDPLTNDPPLSHFAHLLRTAHSPPLEITPMRGDGNCLFRAISLQVYGNSDMHSTVRTQCLDFMEAESRHFKDFCVQDRESYEDYIRRKRCDGVHGNHAEIQAMSELYNRRIEVYVPPNVEPMNIFQQEEEKNESSSTDGTTNPPIRLLYMDGNHYDALVDPLVPTAGLGLGLPGLQPGLADKLQLDQAKRESNKTIEDAMDRKMQFVLEESKRVQVEKEEGDMERVLRESCVGIVGGGSYRSEREEVEDAFEKKALYLSEIEAADFDLEQAVLASSLESYRKAEQERKPSSAGRRGDNSGRRVRYNASPNGGTSRNQRSSSNSPVHRSAAASTTEPIGYSAGFSSSPSYYGSAYPYSASATSAASAAAASSVASFPRARSSSPPTSSYRNENYYESAAASTCASIQASADEYPASVQELVMNGFELARVLHAYDLIGDNFDDLLSFLLSSAS